MVIVPKKIWLQPRHTYIVLLVAMIMFSGLACTDSPANEEEGETKLSFTEQGKTIFQNSYGSLFNRVEEQGYSPTSVNGAYSGMFVRDSSIQVMAHTETGDYSLAERILNYLVHYHQTVGADRAGHILAKNYYAAYGNDFLAQAPATEEKPDEEAVARNGVQDPAQSKGLEPSYFQYKVDSALFLLNAPKHGAAQPFVPLEGNIEAVRLALSSSSSTGRIELSIRTSYADSATEVGRASFELSQLNDAQEDGWVKIPFTDDVFLSGGQLYYLTMTATDTDGNVVWNGTMELPQNSYGSINYDQAWIQTSVYGAYEIITDMPELDKVFQLGGKGLQGAQEIISLGQPVNAVDLYLGNPSKAPGLLEVSLYNGDLQEASLIARNSIDGQQLEEGGGWVRAEFLSYNIENVTSDRYYVVLEAPDSPEASIIWYGLNHPANDSRLTLSITPLGEQTLPAEAGFRALTYKVDNFISYMDQPDGNYMLILAWARFVMEAAPNAAFIQQTYPTIKKFANYYLDTPGYWNEELHLMRNPSTEHTRSGRYWEAYDLITNVFASQALHELASFAQQHGDSDGAQKWSAVAGQLAAGVHEHLVADVDGQKVYAELIAIDEDNKFYPGFSWINLAPVAAQWFATDAELLHHTYKAYQHYGSSSYDGHVMLDACVDIPGVSSNTCSYKHVIGKGLAWELKYNAEIGDLEKVKDIMAFIDTHEKNLMYPETWTIIGEQADPGNQEQTSWMIYMLAKVFPDLYRTLDK